MNPVGFEPTVSAGERPQTHALGRAATGNFTAAGAKQIIFALGQIHFLFSEVSKRNTKKISLKITFMSTEKRRTCIPQQYGCNALFYKLYLSCCNLKVPGHWTDPWTSLIGSLVFVHVYREVKALYYVSCRTLRNRNSEMFSTS